MNLRRRQSTFNVQQQWCCCPPRLSMIASRCCKNCCTRYYPVLSCDARTAEQEYAALLCCAASCTIVILGLLRATVGNGSGLLRKVTYQFRARADTLGRCPNSLPCFRSYGAYGGSACSSKNRTLVTWTIAYRKYVQPSSTSTPAVPRPCVPSRLRVLTSPVTRESNCGGYVVSPCRLRRRPLRRARSSSTVVWLLSPATAASSSGTCGV